MPTPQRLPIVNSDDGVWGDILRQYLLKEHYDDGTDNAVNGGHKTITIRAGTSGAGTAPLKFTSGTLMTTPEAGAVEFNSDTLYFTQTTSTTRKKIAAYDDTSGATGDIYYRNSSGYFTRLGIGSTNDVLTVSGGLPVWQAPASQSPVADTTAIVKNNTDNTKQLKFDLSGLTTATTRTITVPDANTTMVGTDTTQTLTNKTLTSPMINAALDPTYGVNSVVFSAASGSAVNYFVANSNTTGNGPQLIASGSDTNVNINLIPKGTGVVRAGGNPVISSVTGIPAVTGTPSSSTYLRGDGTWAALSTSTSYTANVGDGSSTSIVVTHNLGSRSVVVAVYDATTYEEVDCDVFRTTTNTITLTFATAPATNAYVCVVSNGASGGTTLNSTDVTDSTAVGRSVLTAANATAARAAISAISASSTDTLSNKTIDNSNILTIKDTNFTLQDDGDTTKQLQFQLSGITTGTTQTLTVPNASTTLVGTDTTQTLTNKTLTTPKISSILDANGNTSLTLGTISALLTMSTSITSLLVADRPLDQPVPIPTLIWH